MAGEILEGLASEEGERGERMGEEREAEGRRLFMGESGVGSRDEGGAVAYSDDALMAVSGQAMLCRSV